VNSPNTPNTPGTPQPPLPEQQPEQEPDWGTDRPYTVMISLLSLAIGVVIALPLGALLLALRQPLSLNAEGGVNWTLGAFAIPLALVVSGAVLAWSIFFLPVRLARRQNMALDPEVWPITGVVSATVIIAAGFILALLLGVI
jgi:hypothetical protein